MDIVACDETGPSAQELAAIAAEWPQIEAGLAEVDAEIAAIVEQDERLAEIAALEARLAEIAEILDDLDEETNEITYAVGPEKSRGAWQRHRRLARQALSVIRTVPATRLGVAA